LFTVFCQTRLKRVSSVGASIANTMYKRSKAVVEREGKGGLARAILCVLHH
jgi:uncharacterized membrane protein